MYGFQERTRKYVVGAYPASPAHSNWNPALESEFFETLVGDLRIGALELPWLGSIHPHDDSWLLENFPRSLSAVITDIPFVMSRVGQAPLYGLASGDENGRNSALSDLRKINDAVKKFNDAHQRKVVSVVEIHTAPRQVGDVNALAKSLEEINGWDWDGASVAIEHCDAWVEGQTPEKGFLTLGEEIEALQLLGADIGIFINWGRSAIELRSAERVVEHIRIAKESGLLQGIIFSGASDQEGTFGPAWIDAHHPFRRSERHIYGDPLSLLTEEIARSAVATAGDISWLGIKLSWLKSVDGSISQRHQMISAALDVLDEVSRNK